MAAPLKALPSVAFTLCIFTLLILLQICVGAPGERRKRQISDRLYYTSVCEGSTMDLRCPPNHFIYIEYANFGRTDNVTCVSGPIVNQACYSDYAQQIVSARCNQEAFCQIPTTVDPFDDACPGTEKYLEVLFECKPIPSTTVPPTTTTVPTTRPTTTPTPELTTANLVPVTELPVDATTFLPADATTFLPDVTTTLLTTTTKKPTTTVASTTTLRPQFCMPIVVRGVQWEHAPAGTIDVQPCPAGHTGQATWACKGRPARWTPESGPDLTDCVSIKLQNITDKLNQGASTTSISQDLADSVEEEEELYGGDIVTVTNILTASLGNLDQELQNATAEEKTEKTKEVTKNYLKVGSKILEDDNLDSWDDLSEETQSETASTLITSLEESAFLLADTLGEDETVVEEEDNVVMEVVVRGQDEEGDLVFPNSDQLSGNWKGITDSITLPADSINERTKDGKTKIVILAYNNIGQFLGANNTKVKRINQSSPTSQPAVEKVVKSSPCSEETFIYTDMGDVVNSRVLSVSINDPWDSRRLSKPVNLTFEHQAIGDNITDPVCSFWKFDNNSNEFQSGEWSDNGCRLVHSNETHTVCSCDHLTNFAIIMNVKGVQLQKGHQFALSFITYFGFIISIPCLILALATFCMFKNLQSDRTTIHKNLCVSLILAEVIFVAGISQTENKTMCAIIALLLHYFFLSAFAWMCLEGIQLYIMLVEVFEAESSRRKYYYPFGYVLPLVVVGIAAAIDFESYGTPQYCWICTEGSFIWSFLGPVCLIIFGNILFLSMALYIMCKHSSIQTNPKEKTPKEKAVYRRLSAPINYIRRSSWFSKPVEAQRQAFINESDPLDLPIDSSNKLTSLVRGAVVLLCLLGVTWAFGLLYISDQLIVFAYIFTITNSFQGLFIFIFHCCMNDKVRKEYRRYVRNNTWLPKCIQEQYGGIMLTNSKEQNSYRSSSAPQKRSDSKRYSNATGSYSLENRKMSSSSVVRNSGQYDAVRFNSEMTVPEEEENIDLIEPVPFHTADEGIDLDFDPMPAHESTRMSIERDVDQTDNMSGSRMSVGTTEFQPLIVPDTDSVSELHATLVNVKPPGEREPVEIHPLIRESGFGGSRSGSCCSEDFTPASPMTHDVPTKAHVFANCSTVGMTGSMPDLVSPLTAHARKARMDLVPLASRNVGNKDAGDRVNNNVSVGRGRSSSAATSDNNNINANVAATRSIPNENIHNRFHTLPPRSPPQILDALPCNSDSSQIKTNSHSNTSPWLKRASRIDDIDSDSPDKRHCFSTPSSPQTSNTKSLLETMI